MRLSIDVVVCRRMIVIVAVSMAVSMTMTVVVTMTMSVVMMPARSIHSPQVDC